MPEQANIETIRKKLCQRRESHQKELSQELERITAVSRDLGVKQVILFGSAVRGNTGLMSDLDLLIVWDTTLDFLARTTELFRCLQPCVAADILVYTPDEMVHMVDKPFIRKILEEGRVLYDARCEN